ncbi:MAG: GHKL domain-containing protein, partial [Deltaproteobacteria bacterium]|nr:GHKL domain-containing protein [Deltaproteobacteria bacterium]
TIVGFSELMVQRDMDPDQLRESLDVVCRVSRRLRELVEGLLSYSALGRSEGAMVEVSTGKLLEEVEAELEGLLASSGAELSYRRIPPAVRGRPMELGRVFKNLIENAVHYAKPGEKPEVEVSCIGDENGSHLFCVKDNGIGIEPERARDVFRLFHRGAGGGVGLGLAIVERVILAHSGRIWVESETGEGCRFYFTLPKPTSCGPEPGPGEEVLADL